MKDLKYDMIEPIETESKADLDYTADAFIKIAKEVESNPGIVSNNGTSTR